MTQSMSRQTLLALAEFNFSLGSIDVSEYNERTMVAHWLSDTDPDSRDPRDPEYRDSEQTERVEEDAAQPGIAVSNIGTGISCGGHGRLDSHRGGIS